MIIIKWVKGAISRRIYVRVVKARYVIRHVREEAARRRRNLEFKRDSAVKTTTHLPCH